MDTKIIEEKDYIEASKLLQKGEVVCFPTETVYGIGVKASSEQSYKELISIKGRSPDKPISLMAHSFDVVEGYFDIDEKVKKLILSFYPGQVTFLLKGKSSVPYWVDLGTKVIGLRIPDSVLVRNLLKEVGEPCLVTSANKSGEKTSTEFDEVYNVFNTQVAGIVKGKCTSNLASTIVDLTGEKPKLIREGFLKFSEICNKWEALE